MNPLISIIVPVYKVEQYLDECVQSIRNQTYTNLEIILVDDGSPDRCPEMCDDYAKQDSRIKVIHKNNGGLSSARNAGLEVMSGDYFGFVDSDDYIENQMYEILLKHIDESTQISSCCIYQIEEKGNISPLIPFCEHNTYYRGISFLESFIHNQFHPSVCYRLYSSKNFGHLRFKEGRIAEDLLYSFIVGLEMAIHNYSMVRVPYFGYYYRYVETSIVNSKKEAMELDVLRDYKDFAHETYLKDFRVYDAVIHMYLSYLIFYKAKCLTNEVKMSVFNKEFSKDLDSIKYRKEYNWRVRHIIYYYIVKYIPQLYKISIIKQFCTKAGNYPSPILK